MGLNTVAQVAEKTGLAASTVRKYIREGRLEAAKFGVKNYAISDEAITAFLATPRTMGRPRNPEPEPAGEIE